jgi:peptidoglycan-associated lipoprotein
MNSMWFALPLVALVGCAHPKPNVKDASNAGSSGSTTTKEPVAKAGDDHSGDSNGKAACADAKVHFEFNSATIAEADKPLLERSAECLKADHKLHITIEGNADERGTEEYNLALGDQRAQSVSKYLQALGASGLQLKTVSYGKENPVCSEHDEACWQQNRRASIKVK